MNKRILATAMTLNLLIAPQFSYAQEKLITAFDCGFREYKPSSLTIFCADAGISLGKLKWRSWGGDIARATGILFKNLCEPDCASGQIEKSKVSVELFGLKENRSGASYTRVRFWPLKEDGKAEVIVWKLIRAQI